MSFASFFRAVWDKEPFPWQERLAELAIKGTWPRSIGLPTAAGKTALIDVAVYALAMGAPGAARRIFFVVDRRIIVDEAAERAAMLGEKLFSAERNSELGEIAQTLREVGDGETAKRPLETATLRGGIARNSLWARSPRQPLVVCSTVDQLGSSLLFRAYGTNSYNWPIRAALAGNDSLIILDEAHISQPFAETLESIQRYKGWAKEPVGGGMTVVEMSATPRITDPFREDSGDRENEVLRSRWTASKRTRLVDAETSDEEGQEEGNYDALVKCLVKEARAMRDTQAAKVIGVIANRVGTARKIHEILANDENAQSILLTGRARAYDRDCLWKRWRPYVGLDRTTEFDKPIFVVATQCIEVGANIDFDALVTEAASIDALEQRFGRLNRGGRAVVSNAVIVAQKDQTTSRSEDAIYGKTLAATWKWLKGHVTREERVVILPADGKKKPKTKKEKLEYVEMGVLPLRHALEKTPDRATLAAGRPSSPVLMPAHIDLLCQTSPEPAVSPEPSIFLHGPNTEPAEVQVIWRQDLDENDRSQWIDTVAICPPSAAESVSLPIWVVRKWLCEEETPDIADIEGLREEDARTRKESKQAVIWCGPEESTLAYRAADVRPGDTIVVPAAYGGCDDWGWNPESSDSVKDVGDAVKLLMGRPVLRLHRALAEQWKYVALANTLRACKSVKEAKVVLGSLELAGCEQWLRDLVNQLSTGLKGLVGCPGDDEELAAVAGRAPFEQDSARSPYTGEVLLSRHLEGCMAWAARYAADLPADLKAAVTEAARLHDIGKTDPRFQAWLRGGNPVKPTELLAKSKRSGLDWDAIERARKLAGYPQGGRHELLSVALLADGQWVSGNIDPELMLHLIASHHGRCRPFAPVVSDREPIQVTFEGRTANTDHGLERASSGISERFWRLTDRYGWYGLAYLETILRLADWRRSEEEQKGTANA